MIKQPFKKPTTVKLPQIATKTENSSNGFEPNRRALSSAKNSTTRTDELEKQLFSKLDDYDKHARKDKKAEKLQVSNKVRLSAGGKRETKRTSTAKLQKTTTTSQLSFQSQPMHAKTQTMIESTPLHSNKQNTFLTNPKVQPVDNERKPTQQQLELYGQSKMIEDCPFSQEQMNKLYKEYQKEDCYIEYTSSKQLKQMTRMLNNCQESLNDLTKETQKMMKEIGIIMSQEKEDEIQEQDEEEK